MSFKYYNYLLYFSVFEIAPLTDGAILDALGTLLGDG